MHFLWASTPLTRPLKTAIWSQSWRPDSHQQWWILLKTRVYICCLQVAQIGWPEKFRWENILFLKISVLSWITTLTQMSHKKPWQTVASTSKNKPKNQILMDVMTDHPRVFFFFFSYRFYYKLHWRRHVSIGAQSCLTAHYYRLIALSCVRTIPPFITVIWAILQGWKDFGARVENDWAK